MKKLKHTIILIIFSITSGCMTYQNASQSEIPRETVLSDGMKICATANNEHICVVADGYTKRIISWDGEVHPITLIPRKKRWHGKLGLTEPKQPKNLWKTQNGVMRVLITEAQINYNSVANALKRLPVYREDGINVAYNDNGILVMWRKTVWPDEKVLDLSLFQIRINGKKPRVLPRSQNDKIIITY